MCDYNDVAIGAGLDCRCKNEYATWFVQDRVVQNGCQGESLRLGLDRFVSRSAGQAGRCAGWGIVE